MSRNWSLDSALLTQAIFCICLYLREKGETVEGETRSSPGAYLSLKSHLRALSILCLKGASITMPNLVKVLIKGPLYCYSLHYSVRCLQNEWHSGARPFWSHCTVSAEIIYSVFFLPNVFKYIYFLLL